MRENTCCRKKKLQQTPRPDCGRLCVPQRGVPMAGKVLHPANLTFPARSPLISWFLLWGVEVLNWVKFIHKGTWASLHPQTSKAQGSHGPASCALLFREREEKPILRPIPCRNHARSVAASRESLEEPYAPHHPCIPSFHTPVVYQRKQS